MMIAIDENRVGHIFRDAAGHFRQDNIGNRRALIDVASRPANFLGTDRFGIDWFAETRLDGTQVWVRVQGDKIINGGLNHRPRDNRVELAR